MICISFFLWMLTICVPCLVHSTVHTETIYRATTLSDNEISVNVHSQIQGNITWTYTEDNVFTILLRISGSTTGDLNNTNVIFNSNSSTINLFIDEFLYQQVAAVTGTGNKSTHPLLLLWLMAVLLNWKRAHLVVLVFFANEITKCFASAIEGHLYSDNKAVAIEIRAPRRFTYTNVKLYTKDGNIRVYNNNTDISLNATCSTSPYTKGCDHCCYGNGVCIRDHCVCNPEYTPQNNCKTKKGDVYLFTHPLDPQFSRTVLHNGDVLLLSDQSNDFNESTNVKSHVDFYFNVKLKDENFRNNKLYFNKNGFLRKIISFDVDETSEVLFKRPRSNSCHLGVIISGSIDNKQVYDIDICNKRQDLNKMTNMHMRLEKSEESNTSNRRHRSKKFKSDTYIDMNTKTFTSVSFKHLERNIIDIPVKVERCGGKSLKDVLVKFSLIPKSASVNVNNNASDNLYNSIILQSFVNQSNGNMYLRLPDTTKQLPKALYTAKCKHVVERHNVICQRKHVNAYKQIHSQFKSPFSFRNIGHNTTANGLNVSLRIIANLIQFCDIHISKQVSTTDDCHLHFTDSLNFFSDDIFTLHPKAVFFDGKEIIGDELQMSLRDTNRLIKDGIVIKDDKPEFQIVKISVNPTDPVPGDIYQVRMDYACATEQTIIKMNVTGSDQYTNHVTCQGITSCNCCIVHAAGAANAVIDHVIMHITDSLTKVDMVKEMVVVF